MKSSVVNRKSFSLTIFSKIYPFFFFLGFFLHSCTPTINPTHNILQDATVPTPFPTEVWRSERYQSNLFSFASTIFFDQISSLQGLSDLNVTCIIQDERGFLWFGTQNGLNRYDGYNIQTFFPNDNDQDSISGQWITALASDTQGNLWIGTKENGLNQYVAKTGEFIKYLHNPSDTSSISSNEIHSLLFDADGMLWIGSQGGLIHFNPVTGIFKAYQQSSIDSSAISSNHVLSVFQDSQGEIWAGTEEAGINHMQARNEIFTKYQFVFPNGKNLSNCTIYYINEDNNGYLWLGTSEGLVSYELSTNKFVNHPLFENMESTDPFQSVYSIVIDRQDILWIGTEQALALFNWKEANIEHFKHKPGTIGSISNDAIRCIYEDREGIIWVGTNGGGINKYNRSQNLFAHFQNDPEDPESLGNNIVYSIAIENTESIWLGTYGGGLDNLNLKSGKFTHFNHDNQNSLSLTSDNVRTVLYDSKGTLWVGTNKGLDQFNKGRDTFNHFNFSVEQPTSLSNNLVTALLEDDLGVLWVGTERGLNQSSKIEGAFNRYVYDSEDVGSISDNQITTLFEDSKNNIWIGTKYGGLNKLNRSDGTFTRYQNDKNKSDSISSNYITFILEDHSQILWVSTFGGGINKYDPVTDSFVRYTFEDGLPSNNILGIANDNLGNLWLSTDYGLSRFTPSQKEVRNYTINDGLLSNEFNIGAVAKDSDGRIYFGSVNGLTVFNPLQMTDNLYIPHIALTSLTIGGEPFSPDESIHTVQSISLIWPDNSIEFEFSALSYANPEKNQYAYMLEGFDKDWNFIGTKRNGKYTNLSGGTYTLLLKGTNGAGLWNNEGTSLVVRVFPPFWNTLWFKFGALLALIAAIFIGYRLRASSMQNSNLRLEKQVSERTKLLNQRNWEIEALYRADEKMYRYLNIEHALQALVDVATEMLKAQKSAVFLWDEKKLVWSMKVNNGYKSEEFINLIIQKDGSLINKIDKNNKSILLRRKNRTKKTSHLWQEMSSAFLAEGDDSLLITPIWIGEKIYGLLFSSFLKPNSVTLDTQRLFLSLCQRASLSIENALLFEQSQELAVMEERTRLARDLHDSAKQKAFAALAQLATARNLTTKNVKAGSEHIKVAEDLVSEVIQELTFLIQEMYPYTLKTEGLIVALREFIFEFEERNEIPVNMKVNSPRRLNLEVEQALYRIVQESLINVARHGHASQVKVVFNYSQNAVDATIADNGCGFNPEQRFNGIGLRSMRERACGLKGELIIHSTIGSGTRIEVRIPIQDQVINNSNHR